MSEDGDECIEEDGTESTVAQLRRLAAAFNAGQSSWRARNGHATGYALAWRQSIIVDAVDYEIVLVVARVTTRS